MDQQAHGLQTAEPRIHSRWLPLFIGALLCTVVGLLWWRLTEQEAAERLKRLTIEAQQLSSYIQADMRSRIPSLRRIALRWEHGGGTRRSHFTLDARSFIFDFPGFRAIEWVDDQLQVRWIVGVEQNPPALALGDEKNRQMALEKARHGKTPAMSAPIKLVQGESGFLICFPIQVNGESDGFVVAVLGMQEWLEYVFSVRELSPDPDHFRAAVAIDGQWLFHQPGWTDIGPSRWEAAARTRILDHRFTVRCRATPAFIQKSRSQVPELAAIVGIVLSGLIAFVIHLFQKANIEAWRTHTAKAALETEIQQRKKTERALQRTSDRLALATRAGNIGVWVWELETNALIWNEIMYELYQVPPDARLQYETWAGAIHPQDRAAAEALLKQALAGKAVFDTEFRLQLPDGTLRRIRAASRVERDSQGQPQRVTGVNWDITELKQTALALQHQTEMQRILMKIASTYINIPLHEVDRAIQTALAEIGQYVGADRVYVFDYDFHAHATANKYEWCAPGIVPRIDRLQAVSLADIPELLEAHHRGQPMPVPDVGALPDSRLKALLRSLDIQSLIAVPMRHREALLGFVGFDSIRHQRRYSETEIPLLNLFSQILVNIRLRRRSETALKESELRHRTILQTAMDGFWLLNLDGEILEVNAAYCRMSGYSQAELLTMRIPDLEGAEQSEETAAHIQKILEKGEDRFESRHRRKDGSEFHVEVSVQYQPIEKGRMVVFIRDITERKQTEKQLRHLATHDALTNLPTLRLAKDRIEMAIRIGHRKSRLAGVMFIDLDGFKAVNDQHGHDVGDELLIEVAKRLRSCVRRSDTISRIGGDEFLAVLTELQRPDNAAQVAEKMQERIARPFVFKQKSITVGTSIGIALYPNHGADRERLIKAADQAMYQIKRSGKNGYGFAEDRWEEGA